MRRRYFRERFVYSAMGGRDAQRDNSYQSICRQWLHYKQQLINAAFFNVTEVVYRWPTNTWPKMDHIGKSIPIFIYFRQFRPSRTEKADPCATPRLCSFQNIAGELEGLSLALFTRSLGWSADSVMTTLTEVRKAIANKNVHAWWPCKIQQSKFVTMRR